MKTCIICLNDFEELTIEHIVPEAIGGIFTGRCLCKTCNSEIGTRVDEKLTNNPLIALLRIKNNIHGKKRKYPKLFTDMKVYEEGKDLGIVTDIKINKKGEKHFEIRPKILSKGTDKFLILANTNEELIKIANTKIKKLGGNLIHKTSNNENIKQFNYALESVDVKFSLQEEFKKMIPAFLKIAYELTYYSIGKDYLTDDIAKRMQEFFYTIINSDKTKLELKKPTKIHTYLLEAKNNTNHSLVL